MYFLATMHTAEDAQNFHEMRERLERSHTNSIALNQDMDESPFTFEIASLLGNHVTRDAKKITETARKERHALLTLRGNLRF